MRTTAPSSFVFADHSMSLDAFSSGADIRMDKHLSCRVERPGQMKPLHPA